MLKELKSFLYDESIKTLDFWYKYGFDKEFGGFRTYLDEKGNVWGNEKSVWAQGRGLFIFSYAYNNLVKDPKYLEAAVKAYDFLDKSCSDKDSRMYFIVTREGKGFQKRRYYFSETFFCIGAMELYKATSDKKYYDKGIDLFNKIVDIYRGKTKTEPKFNKEAFDALGLATPMILLSTAQIVRENDMSNEDRYTKLINELFEEIKLHNKGVLLLENINKDGTMVDGPKGRVVNPGHSIECTWFLMNEYRYTKNKEYLDFALKILDGSFEFGWDKEYGGLYAFKDMCDYPCEQLEWDMKLWWPQTEAMIAFLNAYDLTNKDEYLDKYNLVHEYAFKYFKDNTYEEEWYGYLHRDNTIANRCKGNLFKGPFHIPRMLMYNYVLLKNK